MKQKSETCSDLHKATVFCNGSVFVSLDLNDLHPEKFKQVK